METEQKVASHYGSRELKQILEDALRQAGKDPERLTTDDLAPVEEFHIGGKQATADLTAQLNLRPGMHLLDVGSGIGGPARFVAQQYGCRVTGIDLTQPFVDLAGDLTRRVGLDNLVSFRCASALELPFAPETFDGAYMLHVGMNIADKHALFSEICRVLRPGALFAIYDVNRLKEGDFQFPVPWATSSDTSFVEPPQVYRDALKKAGFDIVSERNLLEFAINFFRTMMERSGDGTVPPLGPGIFMGQDARQKLENAMAALEQGVLGPIEMIARKR